MITNDTLNTLSVLVTRPAHQAEGFCQLVENAGGNAIRFPVITIEAVAENPALTQQIENIAQYDYAIFISTNAVHHAIPHLPKGLPADLKIAAVGKKTAASLGAHDIAVNILPKHSFNTEALLECHALQAVKGKNIAIFRGVGGRDLLADTLHQRGANVRYIEVYQRVLAKQALSSVTIHQNCDIITVTSQQGLRNLITLCDNKAWLFNIPLASNSQRTAELAIELGFVSDIVVSSEPGDEAMGAIIADWWQSKNKARP